MNIAVSEGQVKVAKALLERGGFKPEVLTVYLSIAEKNGKPEIIEALKTVYDPEIPVNLYDLGLIYSIDVDPETSAVDVKMTLTAPGCPVAGTLPMEVQRKIETVPGVSQAVVELVWDPPWS